MNGVVNLKKSNEIFQKILALDKPLLSSDQGIDKKIQQSTVLPIELRFIQVLSSVSMNLIGVKILNLFPNEKKKMSLTFVVAENLQERKMIKSPM